MSERPVAKTPYQKMSVSTLKAFMFILYPFAILVQIVMVVGKVKGGILNSGTFGFSDFVLAVFCIVFIGIMFAGMLSCRNELRSRKGNG